MKNNLKHFVESISKALLLLISINVFSQENPSFKITPELSKQFIEKYGLDDFKIYSISSKEIEYYPYVDGQVVSSDYQNEVRRMEYYKPAYEKYLREAEVVDDKRMAIKKIAENIIDFLESNNKYDVKEKLLIDSQSLADRFDIKVTSIDNRLKLEDFINYPVTNTSNSDAVRKQILIYEKDERSNKNDLRIYREEIQKMNVPNPEMTNDYKMYLAVSNNIMTMPKTKIGRILSDTAVNKSVYVIDENSVSLYSLSGEFKELPERYSTSSEDVPGKFVKNELFTKSNEHYNEHEKFIGYPIIKKSGSDEMYYITSDRFIPQLLFEFENLKYANLGNTSDYKTWKVKYISLQLSAQVNVNACKAIINKHTYLNRLGEKRYDSDTFTKQEKITFNKNLDLLNDKLKQIGDLEDERDFILFYNEKASIEEALKTYNISTFYNTTNRSY